MAKVSGRKKMTVVLETLMILPHRTKREKVTHSYTVYARTRPQAIKAVRDAGHKGRVVEVI